jgi:phosphotransferase system  glucose/maltose/N-acetylglucosamine-specific IIC component
MLGRSLLPFGLHFVVNALVSYSSLGGSFNLDTTAKVLYEGHIYYLTSFGDSGTWLNTGLFNGYTGTVIDGQVGINNQLLKYCIGHNVTLYNLDGTIFKEKIALNYDMMFKGT